VEVHKNELEKIHQTIKQVDLYHEELKSQISVVKRTTLKTEEDITKQEIEKKRQVIRIYYQINLFLFFFFFFFFFIF